MIKNPNQSSRMNITQSQNFFLRQTLRNQFLLDPYDIIIRDLLQQSYKLLSDSLRSSAFMDELIRS